MARVKRGVTARARHKKIIGQARGYYGRRKNVFRVAKQAVERALLYAYRDRRRRKRDMRSHWIVRISAAVRGVEGCPMTYGRFMSGLAKAGVALNRKMLADLAVVNPGVFVELVRRSWRAHQEAAGRDSGGQCRDLPSSAS